MNYKEKKLASLLVTETTHHNGTKELTINIMKDDHKIISRTIYDQEKAEKILKLITED